MGEPVGPAAKGGGGTHVARQRSPENCPKRKREARDEEEQADDPELAQRVEPERMRARRRVGGATVLEVCRAEAPRPDPGEWVAIELVERDPPQVVSVRAEREQVGARVLVCRDVLEGAPLVLGEADGMIDP